MNLKRFKKLLIFLCLMSGFAFAAPEAESEKFIYPHELLILTLIFCFPFWLLIICFQFPFLKRGGCFTGKWKIRYLFNLIFSNAIFCIISLVVWVNFPFKDLPDMGFSRGFEVLNYFGPIVMFSPLVVSAILAYMPLYMFSKWFMITDNDIRL